MRRTGSSRRFCRRWCLAGSKFVAHFCTIRILHTMLRLTLAQINPTVGDITGNIEIARRAGAQAAAAGAGMIVFPELSLTGYYPGDLLDEPAFLARVDAGLAA